MKRAFVIIILIISNLTLFGQHNFGINLNGGISRIGCDYYPYRAQRSLFSVSGQSGLFYNLFLGKRTILGTELLFIQIEGKEKTQVYPYGYDPYLFAGQGNADLYQHISYLGIPIYYGIQLKRWNINIGNQASYVLTSSGKEIGSLTRKSVDSIWDNKIKKLNIPNFDFGFRAAIVYKLSGTFSIEGTYYYGFRRILGYAYQSLRTFRTNIQQLTIGLRYSFLNNSRED
jgi:hypothetical protein